MKATGIVRRIDDLGRIVIPKEIRRTLHIRESDPLEIFTDHEGAIILKKYSPIGEMGSFAKQYAESLSQVSGHLALIADRDQIIAAAGTGSKQMIGKSVSKSLEEKMNLRETVCTSRNDKNYVEARKTAGSVYTPGILSSTENRNARRLLPSVFGSGQQKKLPICRHPLSDARKAEATDFRVLEILSHKRDEDYSSSRMFFRIITCSFSSSKVITA